MIGPQELPEECKASNEPEVPGSRSVGLVKVKVVATALPAASRKVLSTWAPVAVAAAFFLTAPTTFLSPTLSSYIEPPWNEKDRYAAWVVGLKAATASVSLELRAALSPSR